MGYRLCNSASWATEPHYWSLTLENSWALNKTENSTPSGASMKAVPEDMPNTVMLHLYCMPRCTPMAGTSTVE
jgi:hypothetical protein